jgi:hypothetical protein
MINALDRSAVHRTSTNFPLMLRVVTVSTGEDILDSDDKRVRYLGTAWR